jgi:hypothetical protein
MNNFFSTLSSVLLPIINSSTVIVLVVESIAVIVLQSEYDSTHSREILSPSVKPSTESSVYVLLDASQDTIVKPFVPATLFLPIAVE